MARIAAIAGDQVHPSVQKAFEQHVKQYNARITNMKATLGHSLLAFEVYMMWYPLYAQVEQIMGKRLAYLYAYSISKSSDCPLCSTFFRKLIIDAGENPENLVVTPLENKVLEFGSSIAKYQGNIGDHIYNAVADHFSKEDMVMLIAFAGQMIATNVFNNVIETDIDEYLSSYLAPVKSIWQNG